MSSGFWNPVPPLGWRMPMTWNGRPPTAICVPDVARPEPQVRRRGRAQDRDAQVVVDRWRRSGTCPARRRRRGPSGRPRSCRRPWSSCSSVPAVTVRLVEISGPRRRSTAARRSRSASSSVSVLVVLPLAGRADRQQVGAEAGQPAGDVRRGPLADADEGDDRGDADDDAEHRQGGAQPARPQARQREPEQLEDAHADDPPVAQVDLAGGRGGDIRCRG